MKSHRAECRQINCACATREIRAMNQLAAMIGPAGELTGVGIDATMQTKERGA